MGKFGIVTGNSGVPKNLLSPEGAVDTDSIFRSSLGFAQEILDTKRSTISKVYSKRRDSKEDVGANDDDSEFSLIPKGN